MRLGTSPTLSLRGLIAAGWAARRRRRALFLVGGLVYVTMQGVYRYCLPPINQSPTSHHTAGLCCTRGSKLYSSISPASRMPRPSPHPGCLCQVHLFASCTRTGPPCRPASDSQRLFKKAHSPSSVCDRHHPIRILQLTHTDHLIASSQQSIHNNRQLHSST